MIIGIGTDLCHIGRIEQSIEKYDERFLGRIFTEHEREYCDSKSGKESYYAKRFAAKEAAAKALSRSDTGSLSWLDVEVRNDPSGRPTLKFLRGARERLIENLPKGYVANIHLSLTDDFPFAQAFVVIEAVKA